MDQELKNKLLEQEQKLEAIYKSVEKTRKYFMIIIWISIIMVVLPIIGLLIAVPSFLSNYSDLSNF